MFLKQKQKVHVLLRKKKWSYKQVLRPHYNFIFFIKVTKNNLKVLLSTSNGDVIKLLSTKMLGIKKWNRFDKDNIISLFKLLLYFNNLFLNKLFVKNKYSLLRISTFFYFRLRHILKIVVKYLRVNRLNVIKIESYTAITHNGCKLKKKKR
jgi:hypothetical protein